MAEEQTLLEWSSKQADWTQDALRRHASTPSFLLDADNKAAILERVRLAAGIEQAPELESFALTADHIKADVAGERTLFCSIGPVSNLGRLAANQRLSFATDGITLIYGDNGSGKTGYCRITKKVCRSPTFDPLLGNIFEDGPKAPAQAVLRFLPHGENDITEMTWQDGTAAPAQLANISVFDTKNARLYIDEKNRFGFLPADIAILERHAAHRREMDKIFDGELKELSTRLRTPLPAGFTVGGKVSAAVDRFATKNIADLPSEAELTALADFSAVDEKELHDLAERLATNPAEIASRSRRSSSRLATYDTRLADIDEGLSTKKAASLRSLAEALGIANQAATLAAANEFADEPLPGVGTDPWQQMYKCAEAYVASLGIALLPTEVGNHCVLCQQPLSAEASERLKRFAAYIAGETAKAAHAAAAAVEEAVSEIDGLEIPTKVQTERDLAEYASLGERRAQVAEAIVSFCEQAGRRKMSLLSEARGATASAPDLPSSLAGC